MKSNLIADLKDMLRVALDVDDYAKVRKFAGYLEELCASEAPKAAAAEPKKTKRAYVKRAPLAAKKETAEPKTEQRVRKVGRPKKVVTVVAEATPVIEKTEKKAKIGRPKKTKVEKRAKAPKTEKPVKEKRAKIAAPKKEKVVKEKKAKIAKVKKEKPAKKPVSARGRGKFNPGDQLFASFRGADVVMTIAADGYELNGQVFPSMAKLVDVLAGENQAKHLRYLGNWKPVVAPIVMEAAE